MFFAILLAATGLTLSAVAIYYSVIGLTAVFAAAFWPVVIMGTTLEVAKLVAASWIKAYWERIPTGMKIYMTTAVIVLMFITSMGIFGFLSKAHLDQNIVSGDVQSKIAIYDEKIKTERENIDAARTALNQMDAQVNERLSRSTDDKGAERAVQIRRQQQAERTRLQNDISRSQSNIARLNEERAPIAAEVRKVEAEVGPIKYIAKLIYGDNPDANLLEKAVTWVIMIIVFVFDPLAVLLLLSAQMTWQWRLEEKAQQSKYEPDDGPLTSDQIQQINDSVEETEEKTPWPFTSSLWPFPVWVGKKEDDESNKPDPWVADVGEKPTEEEKAKIEDNLDPDFLKKAQDRVQERIEEVKQEEVPMPIEQWNKMIEEAEREAEKEKSAKQQWKEDNPDNTIKHQEKLKDLGVIDVLPWEIAKEAADPKYQIFPELHSETSKPEPDFPKEERIKPDLTEVIEPDSSKKKNYIVKEQTQQIKKTRN